MTNLGNFLIFSGIISIFIVMVITAILVYFVVKNAVKHSLYEFYAQQKKDFYE